MSAQTDIGWNQRRLSRREETRAGGSPPWFSRQPRALRWTLVLLTALTLAAASAAQAAGPLTWSSPTLVDSGPHPVNAILSVACPSTSLCVATDEDGNVLTSTNPIGGEESDWATPATIDPGRKLDHVSCPTTTFCIAVDGYGNAFTTSEPTGGAGAWHETQIDPSLSSAPYSYPSFVSCPTTTLCVVATGTHDLVTSTDPAGGASKWKVSTNETLNFGNFSSLSCQSATLCVADYTAAEDSSTIFSTTNPTGGWGAWTYTGSASNITGLTGPSCPTSSLCVGGSESRIVTSTTPATGPWSESSEVDSNWFNDVSCASAALCVGVENGAGHLAVSTEPTGGASKWHVMTVDGYLNSLSAVSCVPGTTTCVAADYEGNVMSSTNPTSSWTQVHVDSSTVTKPDGIYSVSCASASLCVAGDSFGRVLYSTNPKAGASSWSTPTEVSAAAIAALDCIPGLCVGGGSRGYANQIVVSTNPTGGAEAWSVVNTQFGAWTAFSCASIHLCVGVANGNEVASSTTPTVYGSWSVRSVTPNPSFSGVSCASESLCVAVGQRNIYTNTAPANSSTWTSTTVIPEGQSWFDDISCPATTRCYASDGSGNVWTSSDPGSGAATWTKVKAGIGNLSHLSCPTTSFCVAIQSGDSVLTSKEPIAEGSWTETKLTEGSLNNEYLAAISCPTEEICVVTDANGGLASGVAPAAEAGEHKEQKGGGGGGSIGRADCAAGTYFDPGTSTCKPCPPGSQYDAVAHGCLFVDGGPAPWPPTMGFRETVEPVSGIVLVRLRGSTRFVPLTSTGSVPDDSEIDATNGRVIVTVATTHGTQSAEVYGGRFRLHQDRSGADEAHFILSLPLTGCPRVTLPRGSAAAARSRRGPKSRHLWVSEHGGSWGTTGRYVSTSVEGTAWLTLDECDHSEVKVVAGRVKVLDLVRTKTKVLSAGKRYVAHRG